MLTPITIHADLEASTLTVARDYAAAHGLGFPQYLPGLLVAS